MVDRSTVDWSVASPELLPRIALLSFFNPRQRAM
jgi:hypothetical protein